MRVLPFFTSASLWILKKSISLPFGKSKTQTCPYSSSTHNQQKSNKIICKGRKKSSVLSSSVLSPQHSGQTHRPIGTLTTIGLTQFMWNPLSHWSQRSSWSGLSPEPHCLQFTSLYSSSDAEFTTAYGAVAITSTMDLYFLHGFLGGDESTPSYSELEPLKLSSRCAAVEGVAGGMIVMVELGEAELGNAVEVLQKGGERKRRESWRRWWCRDCLVSFSLFCVAGKRKDADVLMKGV